MNILRKLKLALCCTGIFIAASLLALSKADIVFGVTNHNGETILASTTWTLAGSPHVVTGNVRVDSGATLTIEPGCELRFNNGGALYIGDNTGGNGTGALHAIGTSGSPIKFTSNAASPSPGNWVGIVFYNDTNNAGTTMDYCTVEYGGYGVYSNIYCTHASPTIKHSTIQRSANHGIYLSGSSNPVIGSAGEGNSITNNTAYGIYCDSTLGMPVPAITDNTMSNNGTAMRVGPFNNLSNNIFTGNTNNIIEIFAGVIATNITWKNHGLPYVITGDVMVQHSSTGIATLTIEAGCEVKFNDGRRLRIGNGNQGALNAQGNISNPIVFTSNATTPAPGDWSGIWFDDNTYDAGTILGYCTIKYGGKNVFHNIYCYNASPTIQYCTISNSGNHGIYTAGGNPSIVCSVIKNNVNGIYVGSGNPFISNCNITGNTTYGVYKTGAPTINAENNWWGHASGPDAVGSGSGDKVSNYVDYTPWLTLPEVCVATAIELLSFTADVEKDGTVTLAWETATEMDNAGFNIYRSRRENGAYKKLNNAPIPSQGNAVTGASYSYEDTPPASGTYYYKLEDVDYNEKSAMHGPEKVRVRK